MNRGGVVLSTEISYMRKSFFARFFVLLACLSLLASCSSERMALSQMRSLTTTVERHADEYSIADWEAAYEKYQDIDSRIDRSKLTPKQETEYRELKTRCLKSFAKSSVSNIKEGVASFIKNGVDFVKDIWDAIKE